MPSSEFTPGVTWLHLSDIHAGQGKPHAKLDRDDVMHQVVVDARKLIMGEDDEHAPTVPDFVVITGDLTNSAGTIHDQEFAELDSFLARVETTFGCTEVYAVPGNHDCQLDEGSPDPQTRALLDELRRGDVEIDDALVDPDAASRLTSRFERFRTWAEQRCQQGAGSPDRPLGWAHRLDAGDFTVQLVGANSAWLTVRGQSDEGKLQLGRSALALDGEPAEDEVRILLMHHPFGWLRDGTRLLARAERDFHVLMTGHIHEPGTLLRAFGASPPVYRITAGATYEPAPGGPEGGRRRSGHAYNLCSIGRAGSGEVMMRIWPRLWSERTMTFASDRELTPSSPTRSYQTCVLLPAPHRSNRLAGGRIATARGTNPTMSSQASGAVAPAPIALNHWSDTLLSTYGRRRTAFPTDLSLEQLAEQNLAVPTRFSSDTGREPTLTDLVHALAENSNVLVLGGPGAGKSVALLELALACRDAGLVPLIFRFSDVRRIFNAPEEYEALRRELTGGLAHHSRAAILVDGLDEASVTDGSGPRNISRWLRELASLAPLVVSCRTIDFRHHLAAYVEPVSFASVVTIQPWRLGFEFADFVRRLAAGGHLDDEALIETVRRSPSLRRLVQSALFARMLTLIGPADGDSVASEEDLYSRFFAQLSARTAPDLADCNIDDPRTHWEKAAWIVFSTGLMNDDAIKYSALVGVLENSDTDTACVDRLLGAILDRGAQPGDRHAVFVHYSFYEYLLASYVFENLIVSADRGARVTAEAGDLPRRVRKFLTRRLAAEAAPGVADMLADVYRTLRTTQSLDAARTGCNLVVYVLSRAFPTAQPMLRQLLEEEHDDFLRNSLRWGLSHLGDTEVAAEFVAELDSSAEYAAMCRGYLLYYHGDLAADSRPPFYDLNPTLGWSRTKAAVLEMVADPAYPDLVPAARQCIDLHTLFEFCLVRAERLRDDELVQVQAAVDRMWTASEMPSATLHRLQAMLAAVV